MITKLVLIDDDRYFRRSAQRFLESHLSDVGIISCDSAEEGERLITLHQPSVVILDIKLPGIDGLELLDRMEHKARDPFVVVISGQQATEEQVNATYIDALNRGALHFHRKGDGEQKLLAIVRRQLEADTTRRSREPLAEVLELPELNLTLYPNENKAQYADMDVRLTPIESRYLGLLMSHGGNTVSLQTFYEVLCDAEGESARHFDQTNKQNIRTHICYLRKKLGQDSNSEQLIETVRTKGYRLVAA